MNRLKSPLRRLLAVTAGALLGVTGALALTGPAAAQTPAAGAPGCVTADKAEYKHTFDGPKGTASITLQNGPLCAGEVAEFALVSYIAPSAKFALPQFVFDSQVKKFEGPAAEQLALGGSKQTLEFQVKVPSCFTQVDFVRGSKIIDPLDSMDNLYGKRKLAAYNGGQGTCAAAPDAEFVYNCDGTTEVTLINRGNVKAEFTVTADGGFTKTVSVPAGKLDEAISVPAANAKNITVSVGDKVVAKGAWKQPETCVEPPEPKGSVVSDCKELIFTLQVPEGGETITITLTPNKGAAQTIVAEPGAAQPSVVRFKGFEGLVVTPSAEGVDLEPVAWEPPADCDKDNGSGGGEPDDEDEPTLPVTGAAAGGIAAGALALLAIGAICYFVARRRRVTFIA